MILSQKRSISCTGGSLSLYKFCIVRQTANQISGGYKSRRVPGSGSCIQEKIMNYEEARKYLADVAKYGSVPGLDNIRELMKRLGNPQDKLKFIHIAGTNGKGSVLAYLSTILTKAGYRVGRYVSPTLFSYRERIQVDGGKIEKEALARLTSAVKEASEKMKEEGLGAPTSFETETALAWLYFYEKQCDIVVLETGMGGTLDATNIVKTTVLEILTPVSMDHMDFLGDTLEKIAAQKAGIIKPGTSVVSAAQDPQAAAVIRKTCRERNCRLRTVETELLSDVRYGCEKQSFTYKQWKNMEISLAGNYQIENGAIALEAVEALREEGYRISDSQVYAGMKETEWRGRFTLIARRPEVILDGAHNPGAARELRNSLEQYFSGRTIRYIFGMFKDKDYEKVIALTAPLAKHIITVETPDNPRAMPAERLKEEVAKVNPSVEPAESIPAAVKKMFSQASEDDVIIIFGSLSFLGEAEKAVRAEKAETIR
mgnify:FL=1